MKFKGLLGKKDRTLVMYGVIICLSIAILFCIVKLAVRPDVIAEDEFVVQTKEELEPVIVPEEIPIADHEIHIEVVDRARITEDNVNVRSGPGTDYERLGTAYRDFDYEVTSTSNPEWVQIKYDNKTAYIFAEYVEIVPMFLNDMGEYEDYVE